MRLEYLNYIQMLFFIIYEGGNEPLNSITFPGMRNDILNSVYLKCNT